MDLVDWIPTIVTAAATVAVAIATIYYACTLKESARKTAERSRKKDEINSIIIPLISTCNGEIHQLSNKWHSFRKWELFSEKIRNNKYKKIIFNDFIKGKDDLKATINDHEQIIRALAEKHQDFIAAINTDDFRMKIKKLHEKFNQNNSDLKFNQEINSLSKTIILRIIENADVNVERLNDPFENFWKENRKFFLNMRKQKKLLKYLNEIEILSSQLVEKNKFIIKNLEDILNEYTKEYGISLEKELVDAF